MSKQMIAGAITALIALHSSTATASDNMTGMSGNVKQMEKCYGIAKSGQNDCSTASHHCAGEALRDGDKQEWLLVPNGLRQKIVGGTLATPDKK